MWVIRTERILSQFFDWKKLSLRIFLHLRGKMWRKAKRMCVWEREVACALRLVCAARRKPPWYLCSLSLCMWPTDSDLDCPEDCATFDSCFWALSLITMLGSLVMTCGNECRGGVFFFAIIIPTRASTLMPCHTADELWLFRRKIASHAFFLSPDRPKRWH